MRALLLTTASLLWAVPAAATQGTVAVLEFTNASSDAELTPLGKGLQSMITTDLAATDAVQLVERARLTEIQAEIELGNSGAVDPDTAVRFGKLAGASHLLTGSFTVVGDRMRIDARLFDVEDGSVRLGEEITGEVDAFFELEKELVRKLIDALGLQVAARQRAAVARIHTADFEAFRSFSNGIDLFDREAYDDALAQLRDATARDDDFKLAKITLAEYESLIASLRTRRDELSAAREQLRRLETLQSAQSEARIVEKLFRIAAKTSEDATRERTTALYLLTIAYGNLGRNRGKLGDLRRAEDRWAMQRTADTLAASYWTEALALWPAIPIVITDRFYRGLPEEETFDADFAEAVETLWTEGADYPENRRKYLTDPLRWPSKMARLLHLDQAEEVRLRETLVARGLQLDPGDFWRKEQKETLAEELRSVLRLDESTALLTEGSGSEENPYVLEGIAREVEKNRDYQELMEAAKSPTLIREWIVGAQADGWSRGPIVKQGRDHFLGAEPDLEGLKLLDRVRKDGIGADDYILLGPHPFWAMQAPRWLRTGARTDARRTEAVRYYKDRSADDVTDTVVLLDGVPRVDLAARFDLDFSRPDDLNNSRIEKDGWVDGRPLLGFVFGVRDVRVDKQEDPATGEKVIVRPTTQWMVQFDAQEIRLVRMTETVRGNYGRKEGWDEQVLGRTAARWPKKGSARVAVRVDDRGVKVTVDGRSHTFDAVTDRSGFYGFQIRGLGYAQAADVRVE